MESRNERKLRIFHHANRGRMGKYYQGAVKNSLIIFRVQEPGKQEQLRIPAYASPEENIKMTGIEHKVQRSKF